ncbi:MAG: polyprenol monophosphomannose synthase [Candidatus Omnitrophota bacterium]
MVLVLNKVGLAESDGVMVDVSLIIPTYNERENIDALVDGVCRALDPRVWEIVFVDDDSPDGTAQKIRERASGDPRVRLLHRVGRRGLASACIEGVLAASSDNLVIMDADRQHDEALLPKMLALLQGQGLDVVIGSRYVLGGSVGVLAPSRILLSKIGAVVTRIFSGIPVHDPLSGYFAFKRGFFNKTVAHLHAQGFKILLDMLLASRGQVRFQELPYTFRPRCGGKTKLSVQVVADYVRFMLVRVFLKQAV